MHVPVGGEGLPADGTLVGSLAAVDQHVSVQRRGRAQALPADAAGVVRGAGVGVVLRTGSHRGFNTRRPLPSPLAELVRRSGRAQNASAAIFVRV